MGIVSKNRASILPTAIDSGLNQKDVSVKVAVFDNDSNDGTQSLVPRYPQVDWELSPENKGYVFARNKFMATANATYFCSLDDDSWFTDNHGLAKGVRYLENNPTVAAIAYDILSPDRPNAIPEGKPHEVNTFIGCGHLLRLINAREVGLYDAPPAYYGGEEKDICLKLINKGYQIIKLPGVHVWHEKTSVARDPFAQHRSGVCNDLVYAWKRLPLLMLLPTILWKITSHRRFAKNYNKGEFMNACKQGINDFFIALKQGKISRQPVSFKALRHFQNLSGA